MEIPGRATGDYVFLGGFFLVEGAEIPHTLLPKPYWSLSNCVSPIWPGCWVLSWVTLDERSRAEVDRLGITSAELKQLRREFDVLYDEKLFGWQNVFASSKHARAFARRYLANLPGVKLLAIASTAGQRDVFLDHGRPAASYGETGVHLVQAHGAGVPSGGVPRGFEILGFERETGAFHSSACHQLENDYLDKFGIRLNEHGLIPDAEQAEAAAAYTALEATGAEPALWQPWLVFEYPLR